MRTRYLFLLFLLLYFLTTPGHLYTFDSFVSYHTTESLVTRGSLDIPGNLITVTDRSGRQTGRYGLLQSVLSIPLYVVGVGLGRVWHSPLFLREDWRVTCVATFNQWVCAWGLVLFFKVLRRLETPVRPALVVTFLLGFASPWWTYSRDLFRQPLGGVLILWAIAEALEYHRTGKAACLARFAATFPLAVTNRITSVVTWPGLIALAILPERRKEGPSRAWMICFVSALLMVVGCGIQVATNYWRFGHWWGHSYENRHFSLLYLRESLPEFLVSPTRGLFLFAPPLILIFQGIRASWKKDRRVTIGLLMVAMSKFMLFALYEDFRGGVNPGPRYLLPIIPVFFLFIGILAGGEWQCAFFRRTLLTLGGLGFVVNGFNSLVHYQSTLTFWDQLLRAWGLPYEQWPAFYPALDFQDVLVGRFLITEQRGALLAFSLSILAGIVFCLWKLKADLEREGEQEAARGDETLAGDSTGSRQTS
jgi:hypothetical protein